ncbi:MAG: glycerophosphodiester phosphodiesterase family protein, partial [Bacteroidota bacterium]
GITFLAIALWDDLCAGRTDELALLEGADTAWGWLIDNGANAIMTDRPEELMKYLNSRKLRKPVKQSKITSLIDNLEDSQNKEIIVVAHRGDWRHAPENSLPAIQNCIDMGVDMVEIDIRETKDGELVLMHDVTIDRTTNGSGKVSDHTLEELKKLRLTDGLGIQTNHTIPTLEEALLLAKDQILVNLDKSYGIFDKCYEVMKKTNTTDQVVIKGAKRKSELEAEFGLYLEDVHFMPIVRMANQDREEIVEEYLEKEEVPIAFEFTVPHDTFALLDQFMSIREAGSGVWVNSLWPQHNAGHDDEKAAEDISTYDWFVNHNVDMIQTDRPQLLLEYLLLLFHHHALHCVEARANSPRL